MVVVDPPYRNVPLVDDVNSSKTHNDVNTLMEAILVCASAREIDHLGPLVIKE